MHVIFFLTRKRSDGLNSPVSLQTRVQQTLFDKECDLIYEASFVRIWANVYFQHKVVAAAETFHLVKLKFEPKLWDWTLVN